jgi:hypothetical protein
MFDAFLIAVIQQLLFAVSGFLRNDASVYLCTHLHVHVGTEQWTVSAHSVVQVCFEALTVVFLRSQVCSGVMLCRVIGSEHFKGTAIFRNAIDHSPNRITAAEYLNSLLQ